MSFWHQSGSHTCLIHQGKKYSWDEINSLGEQMFDGVSLGEKSALILIPMSPTPQCLAAYVRCLRLDVAVLACDAELEGAEQQSLIQRFQVSHRFDKEAVLSTGLTPPEMQAELALMLTTSGSTGSAKLVKLSKTNLQQNALSITQCLPIHSEDVAISTMPLHYSYGLSVLHSHWLKGAIMVLSSYSLMQKEFWQLCKEQGVTNLNGVPLIMQILLRFSMSKVIWPELRFITQAGGKLDRQSVLKLSTQCQALGVKFFPMYGQTEATARMTCTRSQEVALYPDSIGYPIPKGQLWVLDDKGQRIEEADVAGELVYVGPNVMLGYAEKVQDLTHSESISMLHTGDIGYRDADGRFFVTGRLKRMIKINGIRFSLDLFEAWFSERGVFLACAGNDDELILGTEEILADTLLKEFVAAHRIALRHIQVKSLSELPRLANGKLDYKTLRQC